MNIRTELSTIFSNNYRTLCNRNSITSQIYFRSLSLRTVALSHRLHLTNPLSFGMDGRESKPIYAMKLLFNALFRFLSTLRGHVQAVYMVAWSADSRLLVSGSKDSTLKVWCLRQKKLLFDLPGTGWFQLFCVSLRKNIRLCSCRFEIYQCASLECDKITSNLV